MWPYIVVAALAGFVALLEILIRYRDALRDLVKEWSAWAYIAIHVLASVGALWLLEEYVTIAQSDLPETQQTVAKILVAAFASLAVIRGTVFQARLEDRVIDVGPHALVSALLGATDRSMDRRHAEHRSSVVTGIMSSVDFNKAQAALPTHCFNAMRTVSIEEQEAVSQQVSSIARLHAMPDYAKALNLGFLLIDIVGEDLLRQAVKDLGPSIR